VPTPRRTQGSSPPPLDLGHHSVLSRLDVIETLLGIKAQSQKENLDDDVALHSNDIESPFHAVWTAAAHLKTATRSPQNPRIWSRAIIKQLWLCKYAFKIYKTSLEWAGKL
jgi:hypothetical protein